MHPRPRTGFALVMRPRLWVVAFAALGSLSGCNPESTGLDPFPDPPDPLAGRTEVIIELVDEVVWPGKLVAIRVMNGTPEPVRIWVVRCRAIWLDRQVEGAWVPDSLDGGFGCTGRPVGIAAGGVIPGTVRFPSRLPAGRFRFTMTIWTDPVGSRIVRSEPFDVIPSGVAP